MSVPTNDFKTKRRSYRLIRRISPNLSNDEMSQAIAIFPWTDKSIETLWNGDFNNHELRIQWSRMVEKWQGSFVVGTNSKLLVYQSNQPLRVPNCPGKVQCATWALSADSPLEPLVLYSCRSCLYILNVTTCKIVGYLRGHGASITSISVRPSHPHLCCTTSRDLTIRLYDLTLPPHPGFSNSQGPQGPMTSLGGAAQGLQTSEPEGFGIGRCIVVFVGGRSGGHQAAVLSAAFHSSFPLLATCGLDRMVKIWRIPPHSGESLVREDKPLFSTGQIHNAGVLSISWMSEDVLLSHSRSALMRQANDPAQVYEESGTLILWRWLGLDRFFAEEPYQKIMRGCASDYDDSATFKIISSVLLPEAASFIRVYRSLSYKPMVFMPLLGTIRVLDVGHLEPRPRPPFPFESEITKGEARQVQGQPTDIMADKFGDEQQNLSWPYDHWIIDTTPADQDEGDTLQVCDAALEGTLLIAVGRHNVYIWKAISTIST